MAETKQLTRSESDKMVAGVCGGLGAFLGVDPTLVRIGFALVTFAGGTGLFVYLAMWIIVPPESKARPLSGGGGAADAPPPPPPPGSRWGPTDDATEGPGPG